MDCGRPDKSDAFLCTKENGFVRDTGNQARRLILQMPENDARNRGIEERGMMKKRWILAFCGLMLAASVSLAELNTGDEAMILPGGKPGDVAFPHKLHQDVLQSCDACHSMFGQQAGAIKALIAEGKLKPKQVMNFCTDCHRQQAAEGRKERSDIL